MCVHLHQLTGSLHFGFFIDILCLYAEFLPLHSPFCVLQVLSSCGPISVVFLYRHSVFVCRISTATFTVLCVAGSVVLWSNQCSVFYSRCIFWFILFDQPDVGCGSFKLRRRGRDYAGGKCRTWVIFTQLKKITD